MTVGDVYDFLDSIAPFCNQDKSDNSGLLVGDRFAEVNRALVCLDATNAVVAEATGLGADLIVAHHPLIYRPVFKIVSGDPLHALVRSSICLIATHTNTDIAVGGIADIMLARLGFPKSGVVLFPINADGSGYGRVVDLDAPVSAEKLARMCKVAFGCSVVRYVDSGRDLRRVGVSSGSAKESVELALDAGCDAFVCGEVSHDRMVFAANHGLTLIEAGHFHTEDIVCEDLVGRLRAHFSGLDVRKAASSVDVCGYLV